MNPVHVLRALRALLRVERRELIRNPRRSALLSILIVLPVAAITAAGTLTEMARPTSQERRASMLGGADLRLDVVAARDELSLHPWQAVDRARERMGSEANLAELFEGRESVTSHRKEGKRTVQTRLLAASPEVLQPGGLGHGLIGLARGRYPANAGEVAVSAAVLDLLQLDLDHSVVLEHGRARRVVGEVFNPERLDEALVVRPPALMESGGRHFMLVGGGNTDLRDRGRWAALLPELEATWSNQDWPEDPTLTWFVFGIGLLGCFEAALVIAAAIAIGLRRRQVQIGLLGAVGADALHIGSGLVSAHLLLGLSASAVGVVSGWGLAWCATPWVQGWANRGLGPFEIDLPLSLVALVLGFGTVGAAVAVPAWRAARLPVKAALGGRQPSVRTTHWMARLGAITFLLASLLLALSLRGQSPLEAVCGLAAGAIAIFGLGLLSPGLLGALGRRAGTLPLIPRLAIRDAGRFRLRNGAVVTAVIAAMAMSVTIAGLTRGLQQAVDGIPPSLRADQILVHGPGAEQAARDLAATSDQLAVAPLAAAYLRGEPLRVEPESMVDRFRRGWVAVGDHELLRSLGASEAETIDTSDDRLLVLEPQNISRIAQPIHLVTWIERRPQLSLQSEIARTGTALREPAFVLPRALADVHGVEIGPPPNRTSIPWLVRAVGPEAARVLDAAEERLAGAAYVGGGISLETQRTSGGPLRNSYFGVFLFSLSGAFTLVWIATALSAAESRQDEITLHTVGAERRVLAQLRASRSAVLAAVGCALSVAPGLMATRALIGLASLPIPFNVPWLEVALTCAALPMLLYLSARWTPGGDPSQFSHTRTAGTRP